MFSRKSFENIENIILVFFKNCFYYLDLSHMGKKRFMLKLYNFIKSKPLISLFGEEMIGIVG